MINADIVASHWCRSKPRRHDISHADLGAECVDPTTMGDAVH